jgi:hypothetical protein
MRIATSCPKCQRERRPGEDACARCGLLVARWEGFLLELPLLPPVDQAWDELLRAWHDTEAHRRFLQIAAGSDGLDVAAAHYRQAEREHPDDPRARAGIDRAVSMAVNLYVGKSLAARTSVPSGWLRLAGLAGAIVVVLAALGLFYMLFTRAPSPAS